MQKINDESPLFKSGQGRTSEEIADLGEIALYGVIFIAALLVAGLAGWGLHCCGLYE